MSAVPRGSSGQFAGTAAAGQRTGLATLPDELLLAVLRRLAANGDEDDQEPWYVKQRPYIQDDPADSVHLGLRPKLGLRAYPFLATVCTQWRALLRTPQAIEQLCDSLVIDFGHEVITSIHTPLARSSNPPTSQEWVDAFMELKLSAQKICDYYFSAQRAAGATSLAIHNGDGFGEDDPHTGYFPLRGSHDFGPATLGMALGLLAPHLETLYINNSNSVLSTDSGAWTSISLLPRLRELVVADIDHRVGYRAAAGIGRLTALTRLLLGAKQVRMGRPSV